MTVNFLLLFTPCVLAKQLELLKLLLLCWEIEFQVQIFGLFPFTCSHWIRNLDLLFLLWYNVALTGMRWAIVQWVTSLSFFLSSFFLLSSFFFLSHWVHLFQTSCTVTWIAYWKQNIWTFSGHMDTPLNIKIKHDYIKKQWKCCHVIDWKNKCYHAIWMWSHDCFYAITSGSGSSEPQWVTSIFMSQSAKKKKGFNRFFFFFTLHNVLFLVLKKQKQQHLLCDWHILDN